MSRDIPFLFIAFSDHIGDPKFEFRFKTIKSVLDITGVEAFLIDQEKVR